MAKIYGHICIMHVCVFLKNDKVNVEARLRKFMI